MNSKNHHKSYSETRHYYQSKYTFTVYKVFEMSKLDLSSDFVVKIGVSLIATFQD